MDRKKLYTYSTGFFERYYMLRKEESVQIVSFPQVADSQKISDIVASNVEFDVDISTLVPFLTKNQDLIYGVEHLLTLFPSYTKFIVDQKWSDEAMSLLPLTFNSVEPLVGLVEEKEPGILPSLTEESRVRKVVDLGRGEFEKLFDCLDEKLFGHQTFKEMFKEKAKSFRLFHSIGLQKILSVFLLGPSGVGKTEFGRILCRYLGQDAPFVKLNFGNYSSQDALNSLIGSPRGYIGSEDGELVSKLRRSNSGVILIDEFEKADKKVFNFFLQILEEGVFTDSLGHEHDVSGYIIVFTSNLNQFNFKSSIPPELISRFDLKAEFTQLSVADKEAFQRSKTTELLSQIKEKYQFEVEPAILNKLLSINVQHYSNLREIERAIMDSITNHFVDSI